MNKIKVYKLSDKKEVIKVAEIVEKIIDEYSLHHALLRAGASLIQVDFKSIPKHDHIRLIIQEKDYPTPLTTGIYIGDDLHNVNADDNEYWRITMIRFLWLVYHFLSGYKMYKSITSKE